MPQPIRLWLVNALGAGISEVHEQVGGMSPGCATRLVLQDGRRYFVKVVGTPLNPDTPRLFRRELATLELLGSGPLWADLVTAWDDDDWVALVLEDVEGHHPDLSRDDEMAALLAATDELVGQLKDALPTRVTEAPRAAGLGDTRHTFGVWAEALLHLDEAPDELVPGWLRRDAGTWSTRMRELAGFEHGQLLHWDIRNDNLLVRPTGETVFVDWGNASVGPAWVDPLLARLERVDQPWFDDSVAAHPLLSAAGETAVTTWLVGLGGFLAWRAATAVDVNLPTLGEFRRTESRRCLLGAARRLGLPLGMGG